MVLIVIIPGMNRPVVVRFIISLSMCFAPPHLFFLSKATFSLKKDWSVNKGRGNKVKWELGDLKRMCLRE